MNRAQTRAFAIRSRIMCSIGDGRWYTTSEVAEGHTYLTDATYRALPFLERHGLIEVQRGGTRVVFRVIYNPELYELDLLRAAGDA